MLIIAGGKGKEIEERRKKREFLASHYKNMYYNAAFYGEEHDINKAVLCGVKYVVFSDIDTKTSEREMLLFLSDVNDISSEMSNLTYSEMVELFPIGKYYDGGKWEAKDYWSTIEYLGTKNLGEKIGPDIDDFLWEYYNTDIMNFGVKKALVFDKYLRLQGEAGLIESFLEKFDTGRKVHTYTIHKDEGYIYDNVTGKTSKIVKPRKRKPCYINIVKS